MSEIPKFGDFNRAGENGPFHDVDHIKDVAKISLSEEESEYREMEKRLESKIIQLSEMEEQNRNAQKFDVDPAHSEEAMQKLRHLIHDLKLSMNESQALQNSTARVIERAEALEQTILRRMMSEITDEPNPDDNQ